MGLWLALLFGVLPALAGPGAEDAAAAKSGPSRASVELSFRTGVDAYRHGDHPSAEALWSAVLEQDLPEAAIADVSFDLGNAAFRQERPLEAVAWYTSALRVRPRDRDAWANLEFARSAAGLDPADRGDLRSTSHRLLNSLTRTEAEWLAIAGALLLGLALAGEALRGGRGWRRTAWVALFLALASSVPLAWRIAQNVEDPHMIVLAPAANLRSEPREDLPPVGQVDAAEIVERIDELPGWMRVARSDGSRGWIRATAAQALIP